MKYVLSGDWHANGNRPALRKDDYWETWKSKAAFIIETANEHDAQLLIAGDICDTSKIAVGLINEMIALFKKAERPPIVVAGQHDLKYHTQPDKTPLRNLHLAGAVKWVQGTYRAVTGVDFGQDVPDEPNDILLIHACITEKKPPFFLEDAVSARKFIKQNPQYKVIVSGDYHVPFCVSTKGTTLVNTGTIIRNKKDMKNYVPVIWLLDYDTEAHEVRTVTDIVIPHLPFEEVFDTEAIANEEEKGVTVDVSKLKELLGQSVETMKLEHVVWKMCKAMVDDGIAVNKELVKEILAEA